MCRYIVLDIDPMSRRLGLQDGYGKHHLARITGGAVAVIGDELHGAQPALGLHFLILGRSGHRLNTHFEALRVSRQTIIDSLHPMHVHGHGLTAPALRLIAA